MRHCCAEGILLRKYLFGGGCFRLNGELIMKLIGPTGIAGLVSLGLLCLSSPLLASGTAEINYQSDGKATAKACLSFLADGQATKALTKSGFEIKRSTKTLTFFRKIEKGGLLPISFNFALAKKPGDQKYRRCTFSLSLPNRVMTELVSPEFNAVLNAVRSQFKSSGYKKSTQKNAFGKETEIWTGPHGSYKLQIAVSMGSPGFDVIPAK